MKADIRAFIAIELPADIGRALAALQKRLGGHGLNLRWVRPQNIHLTLKFLGDIEADRIPAISAAMQGVADASPAFQLAVQGLGVFPGIRRARVLWTGLGGATEELLALHRRLEDALADLGMERENRPFKGHLTLARIKKPVDPGKLLDALQAEGSFAGLPLAVNELVLFRSRLRPTGAEYTVLARCPIVCPDTA